MKKLLLFIVLIIFSTTLFSQTYTYSGRVIDAISGEALPFVNIIFGQKKGVTTDINGRYTIKTTAPLDSIYLSFIGYQSKFFKIRNFEERNSISILMDRKVFELKEFVVIPTENPAHRIINEAIKNRDKNNPLKNSSFSYTSYNKMVFTSNVLKDTSAIRAYADTTLQDSVSKMKRRTMKFFIDQHLFMMESVNQRIFKAPDKNFEKVIATKISGFKDPLFTLLITQVQSISFYNDMFLLLDKKFVNPISSGSTSKYYFEIQDTTYRDNDTVFIISYRPRRGTNFDGLKGLLYINTNGYAIQNVIAEPAKESGGFNISIQQQYELIEQKKWFPVQLNTNFSFKNIQANGYQIIGNGTSFIQDIKLNVPLKNREFGDTEVDLDVISPEKSDTYLAHYRRDTLTPQEIRTYLIMDSIGKKENFEKWVNYSKTLMTGKIPIGKIDLDISNFVRFNVYEGWRFDLGFYTNRRLMRNVSIGGYLARGLADLYNKYKIEGVWTINRAKNTTLSVAYKDDIFESGGQPLFYDQKTFFDGDFMRRSFITRFDRTEKFEIAATHRFFKYLSARLEFNVQTKTPMFSVEPISITPDLVNVFNPKVHLTESVLSIKYAFKEKFIKNGDWLFSMGTDYPIITAQFIHGFNNLFNSNLEYNRVEARVFKSIQFRYSGKLSLQISAGMSDRRLPLWGNFVAKSCNNDASLFCDNAFQSIKINSFVSDSYIALYAKHNFGKRFFTSKHFNPEFSLHQHILYGDLRYNNYLYLYRYNTPKSGYYESGLMINKILDMKTLAFGIGVFCNYGKYADVNFKNNFTFLWNFSLPIE